MGMLVFLENHASTIGKGGLPAFRAIYVKLWLMIDVMNCPHALDWTMGFRSNLKSNK